MYFPEACLTPEHTGLRQPAGSGALITAYVSHCLGATIQDIQSSGGGHLPESKS